MRLQPLLVLWRIKLLHYLAQINPLASLASIESLTDIENEMNNLNSFALVYKTIKA